MGTIKRTFANSLTGTGKLSATNLDSNIPAANIADASVTNITTLPESFGQAIKSVAGSPPSQAVGDIWYNTITGTLKNYVTVAAAWASGGNLNTQRHGIGGAGTQTAGLGFGGNSSPPSYSPSNNTNASEEYNGTSWTEGNNLNNTRTNLEGCGLQTSALAIGGYTSPPSPTGMVAFTEEYNGSSWTNGGALNTSGNEMGTCGTQTAGLAFGRNRGYADKMTEEYDGSSWTTGTNMPVDRRYIAGCGTQTAAVGVGGSAGDPATDTGFEYDGSTWTGSPAINTARNFFVGSGIQTNGLVYGGSFPTSSPYTGATESYDGSSWTTTTSLTTARRSLGGSTNSPSTSALAIGGHNGGATNVTEEFTGAFDSIKTVTTS